MNKGYISYRFTTPPPRSGSNRTDPGFWEEFFCFLSDLGRIIIAGDFNGHSEMWPEGYSSNNCEGRDIENARGISDLVCMNNDSPTWCSLDLSRRSILDLFFVNKTLALGLDFEVLGFCYGSDHAPVALATEFLNFTSIPKRPTILVGNINWETFKNTLDQDINEINLHEEPGDLVYEKFNKCIKSAMFKAEGKYSDCIKPSKSNRNHQSIPWWNHRCKVLMETKSALYKNLTANPSFKNVEAFH